MSDFSAQRVPDGNAILDLALMNYVEMRDLTADPDFLLRKKIEAKFTQLHPGKWMPLYSQVTFSNTRYSEALKNDQRQQAIMDKVMELENIHEQWNEPFVMEKIMSYLV